MTSTTFILIACAGALIQEVIHLYDLRNTLHEKTSTFLNSWKYWAITLAMIIVSGVGTWIFYGDDLSIKSAILILGAAFPAIFKKLVAGAVTNKENEVKSFKRGGFSIKDYFK